MRVASLSQIDNENTKTHNTKRLIERQQQCSTHLPWSLPTMTKCQIQRTTEWSHDESIYVKSVQHNTVSHSILQNCRAFFWARQYCYKLKENFKNDRMVQEKNDKKKGTARTKVHPQVLREVQITVSSIILRKCVMLTKILLPCIM
jgi:hypothetical protein